MATWGVLRCLPRAATWLVTFWKLAALQTSAVGGDLQYLMATESLLATASIIYPAPPHLRPGHAMNLLQDKGTKIVFRNTVLECTWHLTRNRNGEMQLTPDAFHDLSAGRVFPLPAEAFSVRFDEILLRASSCFATEGRFRIERLWPEADTSVAGKSFGGWRGWLQLTCKEGVEALWSVELRDGSNYLRVALSLSPTQKPLVLHELILLDMEVPGARKQGNVQGAVVSLDNFFMGYEHPQAYNGDGSLPEEDGGTILRRFVPGWIQGEFALEHDISALLLPGHTINIYLDNWHSDVLVDILHAELVQLSGDAQKVVAEDSGHKGVASRHKTDGNIFVLNPPENLDIESNRFKVRFILRGNGNYTANWVFGLHRKGRTNHIYCSLAQHKTVHLGHSHNGSLVLGVTPEGQLRRGFVHYLERERAHPARPMLHYNSWYDLGTGKKYSANDSAATMEHVSKELAMRGVPLDAFLLDDGWDDPDKGPWEPHDQFAGNKLASLEEAAAIKKIGLGVWFSPFGGYNEPRQRRLHAARKKGLPVREEQASRSLVVDKGYGACNQSYPCELGEGDCETDKDCRDNLICWQTEVGASAPGLDASGVQNKSLDYCADPDVPSAFLGLGNPEYYTYLRDNILKWLWGGARLLKIDGIGNPAGQGFTSAEDFEATISLIADLRQASRRVFINLSTGTWPSPFWLFSADTIWRRGHDHYFEGEGPARERWITYRDSKVYEMVVKPSPLFPINSLMIHGILFAKDAWDLNKLEGSGEGTSGTHFRHEVRAAFGSGIMLQELYLTPSLLSQENWDDVAVAASWARPLAPIFADVHWFGGDPAKGEVYGWAAWRDVFRAGGTDGLSGAVLTLRNPSPHPQSIFLDAAVVFELPQHAPSSLELQSPFGDQEPRKLKLISGQAVRLEMSPFAVLVFDSMKSAKVCPLTNIVTTQVTMGYARSAREEWSTNLPPMESIASAKTSAAIQ